MNGLGKRKEKSATKTKKTSAKETEAKATEAGANKTSKQDAKTNSVRPNMAYIFVFIIIMFF